MNQDMNMTYVQLNEQVTLQNQDPVLNECAARLGVSLSVYFGDIKPYLNTLENLKAKAYGNQRELAMMIERDPQRLSGRDADNAYAIVQSTLKIVERGIIRLSAYTYV